MSEITIDGIKPYMAEAKEPETIKIKTRKHKNGYRTKEVWGTHYWYNVTIEQWNYMRDNNKWPKRRGRYDTQSVEVVDYDRVELAANPDNPKPKRRKMGFWAKLFNGIGAV
jgi:hypothetical protein